LVIALDVGVMIYGCGNPKRSARSAALGDVALIG